MREIKVVIRCDKCGGPDAQPQTETNSKGKSVEVDLDQPCREEFARLKEQAKLVLAPIAELADTAGLPPEKAPKPAAASKAKSTAERPGDRPCLVCPETRVSNTGLTNHMRDKHGFPHSVPGVYGQVCPLDGETIDGLLSRHISKAHGDHKFAHISQAFEWAKRLGDPHGVVAARIAELKKVTEAA